jgi:hypothetical protein
MSVSEAEDVGSIPTRAIAMELTRDQITIHPLSSGTNCWLFYYNGDLYRSPADYYFNIFTTAIEAIEPFIPTTTPTQFFFEKMPVYRQHEYRHRVRIQESSRSQAQNIIKTICDINCALLSKGLIATDIHEGNIGDTVDGIRWWDLGGLEPATPNSVLFSYARVCYLIFRYLYRTYHNGHDVFSIDVVRGSPTPFNAISHLNLQDPATWQTISRTAAEIPAVLPSTLWSTDYSHDMDIFHPKNPKAIIVNEILNKLTLTSVTDVACNKGYYSFMAASKGARTVVGFDNDEGCIKQAHGYRSKFRLPVCFANIGISDLPKIPAPERYSSDLVLALAIVHHIPFSAEFFCDVLALLSRKQILIEDIGTADIYQQLLQQRGFKLVDRYNSYPNPRTLSLYSK